MKILHLISTSSFSGAENVACQIINMYKNNEDVEMYYVSPKGENINILKSKNIKYIELERFDIKNIKKVVNEYKPDIIHAHDIKASYLASFFSKKVKVISHVHNNHENMRKFGIKTFLYNSVSYKFSSIIWVSKSAFDSYYFKKNIIDKSIVLYNVVDEEEINKKASSDNNCYDYDVVYIGRLTYQKNPERLIEIANSISKEHPDFKMAIVGDGDLKYSIEKMIRANNLEKNVFLLGFMNNPYKVLKQSKMLILTSRFEGTPMVALEAMSLGIPIISTFTDGMVDILEDGNNGFLCNDNDEFVRIIERYINDNQEISLIKRNTLKKSKEINNKIKYKEIISKLYDI